MSYVPLFLRKLVIRRAGGRCEYCRLSQNGQEATFHVDHIIPSSSGGETASENLALACVSCSLRKGAREFMVDETNKSVKLFNPREDFLSAHFEWKGVYLRASQIQGKRL